MARLQEKSRKVSAFVQVYESTRCHVYDQRIEDSFICIPEIFYKDTFTSETRAIIIGTSSSILVVLGSIVFLVFFIVYRRKRECGNQDVMDGGVQQVYPSEGEQTTRNITSSHSKGYEDTDTQTIDICSSEGGNQPGLFALDPDHLSQLNKMFSVAIGQNKQEEEKEDDDDEKNRNSKMD